MKSSVLLLKPQVPSAVFSAGLWRTSVHECRARGLFFNKIICAFTSSLADCFAVSVYRKLKNLEQMK